MRILPILMAGLMLLAQQAAAVTKTLPFQLTECTCDATFDLAKLPERQAEDSLQLATGQWRQESGWSGVRHPTCAGGDVEVKETVVSMQAHFGQAIAYLRSLQIAPPLEAFRAEQIHDLRAAEFLETSRRRFQDSADPKALEGTFEGRMVPPLCREKVVPAAMPAGDSAECSALSNLWMPCAGKVLQTPHMDEKAVRRALRQSFKKIHCSCEDDDD